MISVGSRDGRKGSGSGLEMEENELEEGEALGYQEEGEDSTIDPDIALSYIEEKVHRFLGHLQKDFEGGVSAENLGAKFGGYGSFLPTYQRSPSWSHTRSPAEDRRQNSLLSLSPSPSLRPHAASGKAVSVGSSFKDNGYLKSKHVEESSVKSGLDKKSAVDQRTLKVRIKVGSENLSAQKNAELYSGLGLVVSPSSSMEDSPTTSEGRYEKHLVAPEESPTSILEIMTSYSGGMLLSPLSEDLICLTEKKKLRGKFETKSVDKTSKSSRLLLNGSLPSRSEQKVTEQKKSMSSEKDDNVFKELSCQKNNAHMENNVSPLKIENETNGDIYGYDELVSNALKLPHLSSSHHIVADPSKDTPPKQESFYPSIEKEDLESKPALDMGRAEKSGTRSGSSEKAFERKAEKPHVSDQSESNVSKGIKARSAAEQKGGSVNTEVLESSLEKSSKRKQKEAQNKGEHMVESFLAPKSGKSPHTSGLVSKNDTLDFQKEQEKPGDRYKDFFGDVGFEDDDNESVSGEMTASGRLKDPHRVGKVNSSNDRKMSREKNSSRISEKTVDRYAKPACPVPPVENGLSSEAPIGMNPLVQEDWVLCDKCKKWRLLPLGTNPESLPHKWICRMLNWLPGMNRCSIPEETTTNALRALYHPVASANVPPQYNPTAASVGMTAADSSREAQVHQDVTVTTTTINNGKKKHGSDIDGPTNSSNSRKKSLGMGGKVSKPNSMNNSLSVDASEKFNDAKAERIPHISSSDKGTKKIKGKLEFDTEGTRPLKRIKSEEIHTDDENWTSDNGGASSKAGRRSSSLSNNTSGNNRDKNEEMHVPSTSGDVGKRDDGDSRKRRVKENHLQSGDFDEQSCEIEHRKEKKARLTSGSKSGLSHRKSRSMKDQHDNENQAADYRKSEMGSVNPSAAANSSSSKVSGSNRTKANAQEVKGSPVESVSSSPRRFPNVDKVTSATKNDIHDSTAANPGSDKVDAVLSKDHIDDIYNDQLCESDPHSGKKHSTEKSKVETKASDDHSKKSGKGLPSHSKDKGRASGFDSEKFKVNASDSRNDEEKSKSRRNKSDEKSGAPNKVEKLTSKKDTAGGTSSECIRGTSQKKSGNDGQDAIRSQDKKHDLPQERENEKLPKKSNQTEARTNGKSHSLPPLARVQTETTSKSVAVDAFDNSDGQKTSSQRKKSESSNGQPMRHPTPNSRRDVDASPARRDSSSHAANNILKEAKDLKHMADRLKNNTGSNGSIGLYFEASLKFLHGASLLESGSSEATKHNDLMHSIHIYSSTAKLCEFCAHEYEKSKDMGAAALAYKCVEVAYMRVVYSSHSTTSRDRNELQTALQIAAPGESPSSSASDVDNLTHQATAEKAASAKVVGSPQVSGSQIITSRNRSGLQRVLNFAQDVASAMEASKKSRIAFTAATSKLAETSREEGVSSLKKALDYNFQDVEGLLQLVRIAMEAIGR